MHNNYFWYQNQYFQHLKGVAMGAKYAPIMANFVIAKWEEENIYKKWPQLKRVMFQRRMG